MTKEEMFGAIAAVLEDLLQEIYGPHTVFPKGEHAITSEGVAAYSSLSALNKRQSLLRLQTLDAVWEEIASTSDEMYQKALISASEYLNRITKEREGMTRETIVFSFFMLKILQTLIETAIDMGYEVFGQIKTRKKIMLALELEEKSLLRGIERFLSSQELNSFESAALGFHQPRRRFGFR